MHRQWLGQRPSCFGLRLQGRGLRLNLGRLGLGPFGLRVRNLGLRLNLGRLLRLQGLGLRLNLGRLLRLQGLGLRLNLGRLLRLQGLGLRLNLGRLLRLQGLGLRPNFLGRLGLGPRLGLRPTWLRLLLAWDPGDLPESRLFHLALCLPLPNVPGFRFLSYHNEWNLTIVTSIMNHRSKELHGATTVCSTRPSDLFSLP